METVSDAGKGSDQTRTHVVTRVGLMGMSFPTFSSLGHIGSIETCNRNRDGPVGVPGVFVDSHGIFSDRAGISIGTVELS